MRTIGIARAICAFLLAEIHSPRFRGITRRALNGDLRLVQTPDFSDEWQNDRRRAALAATRGYGLGAYLFTGFPSGDVEWRRVELTKEETGELRYAGRVPTWKDLSGGSRLVRDGARNVEKVPVAEDANASILAVEDALRDGRSFPELLLAAERHDGPHVLIEGHTRATAYYRALPDGASVEAIAAYAPTMAQWAYWHD